MRNDRAAQRGKRLDADCYKAQISKHEYGMDDKRCFCYGLIDCMTEEYLPKCRECGAFAYNAQPLNCFSEKSPCNRLCGNYDTCTRNPYRYDQRKE